MQQTNLGHRWTKLEHRQSNSSILAIRLGHSSSSSISLTSCRHLIQTSEDLIAHNRVLNSTCRGYNTGLLANQLLPSLFLIMNPCTAPSLSFQEAYVTPWPPTTNEPPMSIFSACGPHPVRMIGSLIFLRLEIIVYWPASPHDLLPFFSLIRTYRESLSDRLLILTLIQLKHA